MSFGLALFYRLKMTNTHHVLKRMPARVTQADHVMKARRCRTDGDVIRVMQPNIKPVAPQAIARPTKTDGGMGPMKNTSNPENTTPTLTGKRLV